jgi:hypothetical protein
MSEVRSAAFTRLASPGWRWTLEWGWLVELEFPDTQAATRAMRSKACYTLLGDLHLLGMRPTIALANGMRELEL